MNSSTQSGWQNVKYVNPRWNGGVRDGSYIPCLSPTQNQNSPTSPKFHSKKHWHAFSSGMSVEQRHCNYDLKVFHGLGTQPDFFLLTPSESVNHWVIYPSSRFMIVQPWWVLVPHIVHVDFTSFNKPLKKHITSAKWSDYAFESKISSKKHMTNRTCRIRPLLVTLVIFPINFHN